MSARLAARQRRWASSAAFIVSSLAATHAFAQTAAPAGPSIKVGTTLFANYSYTFAPKTVDATGREVSASSFDITRAYLTITGDITPRVSFRVTSDVVRETGSGGSLDGSLVLRLKYAYMQLSLTPWLGQHTWVRFGLQNTPITYAIDQIYRYRFQGSPVPERDAGLSSSDAGVSLHLDLPGGHGDVHAAVLNGEGYTHAETNGEKALQVRTTYKPVTEDSPLEGISLQLVVNYDHYAADLPRHRVLASAFYEHRRFNAGLDVLGTARPAHARVAADARRRLLDLRHAVFQERRVRVRKRCFDSIAFSSTSRPGRHGRAWWLESPTGSRTRAPARPRSCSTTRDFRRRTSRARSRPSGGCSCTGW